MVKGLYIAATGLLATKRSTEHIANNLANIETVGFKKDVISMESFNARLFSRINGSSIPYEYMRSDVEFSKIGDFYHASAKEGYFKVQTVDGIHYAKEVKFMVDQDGYLSVVHKAHGGDIGYKLETYYNLLSNDNKRIFVGQGAEINIDKDGKLSVNGNTASNTLVHIHPKAVGTLTAGVKRFNAYTNFEQGVLEINDSNTAVAIQGEGFFRIDVMGKEYLTRNGNFVIDANGQLVTVDGAGVIGLKGKIFLDSTPVSINELGEIVQNGEVVDTIQTKNFSNVNDIEKVGAYYFRQKEDMVGEEIPIKGKILQNFIERSNTSAIEEMVRLIEMHRSYESSQKAVTTIDDMLGRAVNDIGKV